MRTRQFAKRILCLILVCATVLSLSVPVFAANSTIIPEPALNGNYLLTHEESFLSDDNHTIRIILGADSESEHANTCSVVYVDGQLNSISYTYPADDKILEYNYSDIRVATSSINGVNKVYVKEYKLSDYVVDTPVALSDEYIEPDTTMDAKASAPWPKFIEDDGWVFSSKVNAVSSYPYDVYSYYKNFDQEPYNHPFMKKEIHLFDGMMTSTVSGILASYLESKINKNGLTMKALLISLGVSIVVDAGISIIKGEFVGSILCSTQKILYAPVVEGYVIYPGAYLEKLWLIAEESKNKYKAIKVLDDMYDSYPSQFASEDDLMYIARHWFTDWARNNGYNR